MNPWIITYLGDHKLSSAIHVSSGLIDNDAIKMQFNIPKAPIGLPIVVPRNYFDHIKNSVLSQEDFNHFFKPDNMIAKWQRLSLFF
jgi:hypothetical protein